MKKPNFVLFRVLFANLMFLILMLSSVSAEVNERGESEQIAPSYKAGELLIKFSNQGVIDQLQTYLYDKSHNITLPERLNTALVQLSQANGLQTMRRLFLDNFTPEQLRVKFPKRSQRIPPGVVPPDLTKTYLLTFTTAETDIPALAVQYTAFSTDVIYAEPNYLINIFNLPNDTYVDHNQDGIWSVGAWGNSYEDMWGLKCIGMDAVWPVTNEATDIIVAVSDTGIDYSHPDFASSDHLTTNIWQNLDEDADHDGHTLEWNGTKWILDPGDLNGKDDDGNGYVDDLIGYDFGDYDSDPMDDAGPLTGHGTHVAGTIAAFTNNNLGVASISQHARVMAVKGWESTTGSSGDLVSTIRYATVKGADVINMSWGGVYWQSLVDALNDAYAEGVVLVAAAGNKNADVATIYPAALPHVICVAGWDHNNNRASFSNWGDLIDVTAPAVDILSLKANAVSIGTIVGNDYIVYAGTSMASPHIAGLAALILSKNPTLTPDAVEAIIESTAQDVLTPGKDPYSGYGLINPLAAINEAQSVGSNPLSELIITDGSASALVQSNSLLKVTAAVANIGSKSAGSSNYAIYAGNPDIGGVLLVTNSITPLGPGEYIQINDDIDQALIPANTTFITIKLDSGGAIPEYNERNNFLVPITLPYLSNWPKQFLFQYRSSNASTPAISNIDEKGDLEIVVGSQDGKVYVFDSGGNYFGNWPQIADANSGVNTSAKIINFDFDYGGLDLLIGSHALYAWHEDTSFVDGWPQSTGAYIGPSPAIADIDPSSAGLETVVGSSDGALHCWKHNGEELWSFPTGYWIFGSPAVADIYPNEPGLEIVFGSLSGYLYCLKSNGQLKWSRGFADWVNGSPAVADLDPDKPGLETVIVPLGREIYCLDKDGDIIWSFNVHKGIVASNSAVIADINGDGNLEVIVGMGDGVIYCLDKNGQPLWGYQAGWVMNNTAPAIADVDGDGGLEVVIGADDGKLYAVHGDGTPVYGWPQITHGSIASNPSIADINRDGRLEVVVTSYDGNMYIWQTPAISSDTMPWPEFRHDARNSGFYNNKSLYLPNWPKSIDSINSKIDSSPTLADIDGDGKLEVVIGAECWDNNGHQQGRVYAWHEDGNVVSGWPQITTDVIFSSVAIADLDPDYNGLEVVAADTGGYIYAWHKDGISLSGWPKYISDSHPMILSSVAVADIDNDGVLEVVVSGTYFNQTTCKTTGRVCAWRKDGTSVSGWPQDDDSVFGVLGFPFSSPSIADLDPNVSGLEIVVGTPTGYGHVYAWHKDGSRLSGWPVAIDGYAPAVCATAAIADLDLDNTLEVVTNADKQYAWHYNDRDMNGLVDSVLGWPQDIGNSGAFSSPAIADLDTSYPGPEIAVGGADGKVYLWHNDGTLVPNWPQDTGSTISSSPALADVDGDGNLEVILSANDHKVYAWHTDGTPVIGWPQDMGGTPFGPQYSSAAIADINNDGKLEVVAGVTYFEQPNISTSKVYIWTLPWETYPRAPWPMFHKNRQRTGSNAAPILNPIGNKSVNVNSTLRFNISATDADNDCLTYSATGLPSGATFDAKTQTFSWVPTKPGTYSGITFSVKDYPAGVTRSEAITITVRSGTTGKGKNLQQD